MPSDRKHRPELGCEPTAGHSVSDMLPQSSLSWFKPSNKQPSENHWYVAKRSIVKAAAFKFEFLPKSVCSLSYKVFKLRYLDEHSVWKNPVSLSKPTLPVDVKHEESRILLHKLWHQETCPPAWRPEDGPKDRTLLEWIPRCEVPQHQTVLMELQHSFSKAAAQKRLHDSVKGERKNPHR